MTDTKLQLTDLNQFTGTENWYRHWLNRNFLFTDGIKYVADQAGAYWLIDEIALAQRYDAKVKAEEFQVWKLTVRANKAATLNCEDGNHNAVFSKELTFTDFPLPEIVFWFENDTLYLPSER